jgi:FAD:protein FMN transferase
MAQFNFSAIGTMWQIDIYTPLTSEKEVEVFDLISKRINEFDGVYSRFNKDSLVTKMSREIGMYTLPPDAKDMFDIYYLLNDLTSGYFTPLVGDMLVDAGYDAHYSLEPKKSLSNPKELSEVMNYEFPKLQIKIPTMLDFGAGGKGYLIDLVSQVLEHNNIFEYCIDAGGDMKHRGTEAIKVGLENPDNFSEVVGICELKNMSLCGSAGSRRKWAGFNHIMDPKTLTSVENIKAVWTVADTTLIADSLATCLFFVHPDILIKKFSFEYCVLYHDNTVLISKDFPGEVFGV